MSTCPSWANTTTLTTRSSNNSLPFASASNQLFFLYVLPLQPLNFFSPPPWLAHLLHFVLSSLINAWWAVARGSSETHYYSLKRETSAYRIIISQTPPSASPRSPLRPFSLPSYTTFWVALDAISLTIEVPNSYLYNFQI